MHFMNIKDISPDQVVLWQWGFFSVNSTILFTWIDPSAA
jgi:F-type H+-transporting ATPase subunit a